MHELDQIKMQKQFQKIFKESCFEIFDRHRVGRKIPEGLYLEIERVWPLFSPGVLDEWYYEHVQLYKKGAFD
ncbi:MAG TPA: hypothetical protein VFM02_02970 [Candidatus Paceibacterota bacterium]|nr:hypothetical protein [Candidatus Paceibacterota bacterium]